MDLPFWRRRAGRDGDALLARVIEVSRRPEFYGEDKVPDTLEGRFELLALNAGLVQRRLRAEEGAAPLAQAFTDRLFSHLDAGLRESGVGDLAVPKRMRALAGAFYGRLVAYSEALNAGDRQALAIALGRNVLGDEAAPYAGPLADHALGLAARQAALSVNTLAAQAAWAGFGNSVT